MEQDFEFDSGLEIISPTIYVEADVCNIINTVQKEIDGKEISILFKSRWIKQGYYVSSEYIIPEQTVDTSSVDYKDEGAELYGYRQQGYNAVMHSHPFSGENFDFSSADDKYINSHFPCSILCNIESTIIRATLLMQTDHASNRLRLKVGKEDINLYHPPIDIIGINNIKQKPKIIYHQASSLAEYDYYKNKNCSSPHLLGNNMSSLIKDDDYEMKEYIEAQLAELPDGKEKDFQRAQLYEEWGVA